MKIRSRKDLPQTAGDINFLNPKKPKTFIEKLNDWIKKEAEKKAAEKKP